MLTESGFWKVLIVDDEKLIHYNLEINLRDMECDNKKIKLLHSLSAFEAKEIIKNNNDIAVIVLDVMMEEDNSGLDFVNFIRDEMKNSDVRILLHTGQAGIAPKKEVASNYMIDGYLDKNTSDNEDCYIAVKMAIKAYQQRLELKNSSIKTDVELLQEIASCFLFILQNWNIFEKYEDVMPKINSMMLLSHEILASYLLQDLKENLALGTTKSKHLSYQDYSALIQIYNLKIILMQITSERFEKEKVNIFGNIIDVAKNFLLIKILPELSKKELEKCLELSSFLNNKIKN